jgi:hypothetical protein
MSEEQKNKRSAEDMGSRGGGRANRWRLAAWSTAVLILLLPLVAMQFTDQVNWGLGDFALAGALLFGTLLTFELAVRSTGSLAYRGAVGLALAAAVLLIWVNLAVGIIGSEDEPANLLYACVLAAGLAGALLARFQPAGMARALFAAALAQALIAVLAVAAGWGAGGSYWPLDLLALNGVFVALFAASGMLFRYAAHDDSPASAGRGS